MEDKKIDFEEKASAEATETKKERKFRIPTLFKKKESSGEGAEQEAAAADKKPKISVKKIAVGVGATLAVAATVAGAILASRHEENPDGIDPDWDQEPGEDYPEIETQDSVEEPVEVAE